MHSALNHLQQCVFVYCKSTHLKTTAYLKARHSRVCQIWSKEWTQKECGISAHQIKPSGRRMGWGRSLCYISAKVGSWSTVGTHGHTASLHTHTPTIRAEGNQWRWKENESRLRCRAVALSLTHRTRLFWGPIEPVKGLLLIGLRQIYWLLSIFCGDTYSSRSPSHERIFMMWPRSRWRTGQTRRREGGPRQSGSHFCVFSPLIIWRALK